MGKRDGRDWREVSKVCPYCGTTFYKIGGGNWDRWDKRIGCSISCAKILAGSHRGTLPDEETLQKNIEVDLMTKNQIAELYGVHPDRVERRINAIGLKYKHSNTSMEYKGLVRPTRDEMVGFLEEEFLTYKQIAGKYGVNTTTIGRWIKGFGIPPYPITRSKKKGFDPGPLDEEKLRSLYEESGMTSAEIAKDYKTSATRILGLLRQFHIKVKRTGLCNIHEYACKNGVEVKSSYEVRIGNWFLENGVDFSYEPKIPGHPRWRADFLANGYYVEIWGMVGCAKYHDRKQEKIAWYTAHGIPLIQLGVSMVQRGATYAKHLAPCLAPNPVRSPRPTQMMLFG